MPSIIPDVAATLAPPPSIWESTSHGTAGNTKDSTRIVLTERQDWTGTTSDEASSGASPPPGRELSPLGTKQGVQSRPPELSSLSQEIVFATICSSGQLFFAALYGNIGVNLESFRIILGLESTQLPWLTGSYFLALGLSVVIFGSLADLVPPRWTIIAAFTLQAICNVAGAFSLAPSRVPLFYLVRAIQGLSVDLLVSSSMSVLGRIYAPGRRKTLVFSYMGAFAPLGFLFGSVQGGALASNLMYTFVTNAFVAAIGGLAAWYSVPDLCPVADMIDGDPPTWRDYDIKGAICASAGSLCLLFGLTQGTVAAWSPYTYATICIGLLLFALFFWVETKVARPLVPAIIWRTPGFKPLMIAFFLGFGGFVGAWQFYALQFFLRIQRQSPLVTALFFLPNCIVGIMAALAVGKLLHRIPGHHIYITSMVAFSAAPLFFLFQEPDSVYWTLSLPSIAIGVLGPDLSFAAAAVFITSNVTRSYQGSAGSLLITVQNLSSAIFASIADALAAKTSREVDHEIDLYGLRSAWWLAFAAGMTGAVVTMIWVRIPKKVDKDHVL